jgi:hypothetical protein
VELWEWPNELGAGVILPVCHRHCQYYLLTFGLFAQQTNTNRPFQFQEGRELIIRVHNEMFSVIAMCIGNPYYSALASNC